MPDSDLRWTSVGTVDSWQPNQGRVVQVGARRIAVFRTATGFHALKDACPHAGVSLAHGPLDDGCVVCPAHDWRFRLSDGVCTSGGANCQASVFPVRLSEGQVQIGV